ncbi:MAG TPA: prepilin-type N-terminal cleavage/methylation domain-containing protein [Longimicrobium sp.]|uniref:PilW family protein n=1 Tax=Longimicrobium sp. TaxID=2029185 RepID=UPI002EDA2046
MHSNKRLHSRAGFTLVELMVGLVLGIVLVSIVLQFVTGQTRIASAQTAREEVQQNARGAVEVVASDLRGTLSRGLVLGGEREIQFILPRRWGVVCARAGDTNTTVVFPVLPGDAVTALAGQVTGLASVDANGVIAPALPARATVTGVAAANLAACVGVAPVGTIEAFTFTGAGHTPLNPGAVVAVYQDVRYDLGQSSGRWWVRRSSGAGTAEANMQPLAGPVDPERVSFEYLRGTPPLAIGVPGANASTAGVTMIRFNVRTLSRQQVGTTSLSETGSVTVQIRN